MHRAFIGLGSNLDNPQEQIKLAIKALKELADDQLIIYSSLYQSLPLVKEDTAKNSEQPDYFNAVALMNTTLSPIDLLDKLQAIETVQGRKRSHERWSARTLDLDILLYDNEEIHEPRLTVPHYGIKDRNFVIYPLIELDDNLIFPDGTNIKALYKSCSSNGIRKIE